MDASLLLLADSRLPAGGHAHSGGLEPAVTAGAVTDVAGLTAFLRGRLSTSGLVSAALAAAACAHATSPPWRWAELDAEADARTPSPAQRRASRAQGRSLLRAARSSWPHPALDALHTTQHHPPPAHDAPHLAPDDADAHRVRGVGRGPHHAVVLGVAAAAAGGGPEQAAAIAAYHAVTAPASAAVRLLGLDPLAVNRALADLAGDVDATAREAAARADDWAALPAASGPALDLYAETHVRADLRLFES
ncbi:urease accessory protein UreF [Spirillospora sp. CA-294931]|uniref:urease accessory protein UreF n=1 Tax=Spirillospora sp. CA-294931 TaxID=3240042 RepID=UPI003D91AD57